jgi:hypothetical protein
MKTAKEWIKEFDDECEGGWYEEVLIPRVQADAKAEGWREGLQAGFDIARDNAEISEHDGWHRTGPRNDWTVAEKELAAALLPPAPSEGSNG